MQNATWEQLRDIPVYPITTTGIRPNTNPAPNFNTEAIMLAHTLTAQAISDYTYFQMGKGGNQGQWDDELSPLDLDVLLELLKQAIASGDKQLKRRIEKELKRRGLRNKGKNRGRGDIK